MIEDFYPIETKKHVVVHFFDDETEETITIIRNILGYGKVDGGHIEPFYFEGDEGGSIICPSLDASNLLSWEIQ